MSWASRRAQIESVLVLVQPAVTLPRVTEACPWSRRARRAGPLCVSGVTLQKMASPQLRTEPSKEPPRSRTHRNTILMALDTHSPAAAHGLGGGGSSGAAPTDPGGRGTEQRLQAGTQAECGVASPTRLHAWLKPDAHARALRSRPQPGPPGGLMQPSRSHSPPKEGLCR